MKFFSIGSSLTSFRKFLIELFFFTSLGICSIAQATQNNLTLSEAIHYAIEHSPLMDSANKTQSIRDLEYKNTIAKLLPSLDFSATHGLQNNIAINNNYTLLTPSSTAPWYSALNLGITENLYDNGTSLIQLSIADKNQEASALSNSKVKASLTLDVATEFYRFSLLNALTEVRQKQLETLEKQFSLLTAQYQQGLKPKLDFLRFKTQVQRAQLEKTTTEKNKDLSTTTLIKLLGFDLQSSQSLQFEPVLAKNSLLEALSVPTPRLQNFYDYKITQLQKDVNDKNVSFTKRKYWPQVFVGAGVTYSNFNYLNSGEPFSASNQLSYNALLTLQYNIWDWGTRRRDVAIAEYNRDIQDNQLNLGLLEVRSKIDGLMIDLARVKDNYSLTQELLQNEEQNYHNIEIQYHEGKVTYLDLITSLSNLLDAKVQFYSVHFEALQLLAKHWFYEGSIYEKLSKNSL